MRQVQTPKKVHEGGTEERDLLGSTLLCNQKEGTVKIHVKDCMEKMLTNPDLGFNMGGCGASATPCAPRADLSSGKDRSDFPMRRLVGGLLWLAVMCRPDIQCAVSELAQFADKPTQSAVAELLAAASPLQTSFAL